MEKKSVVITPKGYSIKVADHMLGDLAKFGVTKTRPQLKPAPKELTQTSPVKKDLQTSSILPKMEEKEPVINTESQANTPDLTKVEPEKKVRKTPVRSKSKK